MFKGSLTNLGKISKKLFRDHQCPRMNPGFNAEHPTPKVNSVYPILSTNGLIEEH